MLKKVIVLLLIGNIFALQALKVDTAQGDVFGNLDKISQTKEQQLAQHLQALFGRVIDEHKLGELINGEDCPELVREFFKNIMSLYQEASELHNNSDYKKQSELFEKMSALIEKKQSLTEEEQQKFYKEMKKHCPLIVRAFEIDAKLKDAQDALVILMTNTFFNALFKVQFAKK